LPTRTWKELHIAERRDIFAPLQEQFLFTRYVGRGKGEERWIDKKQERRKEKKIKT
jgi:hypothetical protein